MAKVNGFSFFWFWKARATTSITSVRLLRSHAPRGRVLNEGDWHETVAWVDAKAVGHCCASTPQHGSGSSGRVAGCHHLRPTGELGCAAAGHSERTVQRTTPRCYPLTRVGRSRTPLRHGNAAVWHATAVCGTEHRSARNLAHGPKPKRWCHAQSKKPRHSLHHATQAHVVVNATMVCFM
jgi:hypothetical protein